MPRSCCENLPPKISTSLSRISVLLFWITPRKHCELSLKVVPLQTEVSASTTRGCGCSLGELLTQTGYINSDTDILRLREDDDEPTLAAPPAARGRDTAKKRSQPASPTPANGANGAVLKFCLCLFLPPGLTRLHPWPLLRARWEWMLRRSLYSRLMRREEESRKRFNKVWQPCPLQQQVSYRRINTCALYDNSQCQIKEDKRNQQVPLTLTHTQNKTLSLWFLPLI